MNPSRLTTITLLLLMAQACAGEDPAQTPNPPPPAPARSYCEVSKLGCERQLECGAVVYNHHRDVDDCLESTGCAAFTDAQLDELGVQLDAAAVDACLAAIEALSCEHVAALRHGFGAGLEACRTLTKGSIAEGGDCRGVVFDDCAPGAECVIGDMCPGTCTATVAKCDQTSCGTGEYCSYATERCVPMATIGEPCEGNLPFDYYRRSCTAGSYCALHQDDVIWTCEPVIARGGSCATCLDPECCEAGTYCSTPDSDPATVCVDRLEAGGACNFAAQCDEGLYCDFSTGTCKAPGPLGAVCTDSTGACAVGLRCAIEADGVGRCARPEAPVAEPAPLLEEGEACDRASICPLGMACVDPSGELVIGPDATGVCAPTLGQPGDACEPSFDAFACAEGLCNFATGQCPIRLQVGDACELSGIDSACPFGLCLQGKCAAASDLVCEGVLGER